MSLDFVVGSLGQDTTYDVARRAQLLARVDHLATGHDEFRKDGLA
jgi:hypothetical protein